DDASSKASPNGPSGLNSPGGASGPGEMPGPTPPGGATSATTIAAGQPEPPDLPAAMVLVHKPDGSPWFYVDPLPVTARAFRQLFDKHEQAGSAGDSAV